MVITIRMIIHIIGNIMCCNVIIILIFMFCCKIGIQSYICFFFFFYLNILLIIPYLDNIIFTQIKKLQINNFCIPILYNSVRAHTHKHSSLCKTFSPFLFTLSLSSKHKIKICFPSLALS